jgi:hypothetical protein
MARRVTQGIIVRRARVQDPVLEHVCSDDVDLTAPSLNRGCHSSVGIMATQDIVYRRQCHEYECGGSI